VLALTFSNFPIGLTIYFFTNGDISKKYNSKKKFTSNDFQRVKSNSCRDTFTYNAQKEAEMKFSCIPPNLSWEKHGMVWVESRCYKRTWCRWELKWALAWGKIDGIHHYNYRKAASNRHRLSFDVRDMDSVVKESKLTWWW